MSEPRSLRVDLLALALFAFGAFLSLALTSYNPADAPGALVFPPGGQIVNACGRSGAFVAELMLRVVGIGAYFVLVSIAVLDVFLLARKPVTEPILRGIGWVMSLVGLCTFASLAMTHASPGPVVGPGGYVGAAGRAILEMNFANAGAFVLTISVIIAGLLLTTDYVLVRMAAVLIGKPTVVVANVGRSAFARTSVVDKASVDKIAAKRKSKRGDLDDTLAGAAAQAEADDTEPAVRVRGKRRNDDVEAGNDADDSTVEADVVSLSVNGDDSDDDDADLIDADNTNDAEEPADVKPKKAGLGSRLASALRIKNNGQNAARDQVIEDLEAASRTEDASDYELPPIDLLLPNETVFQEEHEKEVREKAKKLEKTFASFGFKVKVVEIETGPVIAQYEVELEAGLRLSKITSLADDIAIALRVPSVRIVAPIPGKNTVGIEVPNATRQLVRLREVIEEINGKAKKMRIPIYLGKDVAGNPMVVDLTTLPHLLIAGRTGTGKSVCLNSIIVSMLMSRRPDEVKMLMIDPKMVELSPYKTLPHLMHPVVTDMRKAEAILAWAVEKMEERYALLASAGVRHISVYNQLGEEELMDRLQPESDEQKKLIPLNLPYIVIVADEIADLMMTSGKEVEQHIIRLAQKSRAVGIHLILATQKPTVDVITGLIKSNLPARIAFQVASRTDSRVVLDEMGADKLLGNGDMLFLWPGTSTLLRGQGTYLSDDEINRVVDFVGTTEPQFAKELVTLKPKDDGTGKGPKDLKSRDELYESAIDIVIREGRGSVSLLQRALGIGYGRAARLVDFMAEDGIVGDYNGSQAREVLITLEQWAEMSGEPIEAAPPAAPRVKKNRILPDPVDEESDEESDEDVDEETEDDDDDNDPDDFDPDGSDPDSDGSIGQNDDDVPAVRTPSMKRTGQTSGPKPVRNSASTEFDDEVDAGSEEDLEESDVDDNLHLDEHDSDNEEFDECRDEPVDSDALGDSIEADENEAQDSAVEESQEAGPRSGTTISSPALASDATSAINPALLERLRLKQQRDQQGKLRRSA